MIPTPEDILDYWYADEMKQAWFQSTSEIDAQIRDKYESLWEQAASANLNHWAESAEGALALVIILDQFPLNMFRNEPRSYQTESLAIQITHQAVAQELDCQLAQNRLAFLYMPLMHSENIVDQELSVQLFEQTKLDANIRFARHHRDIIKKFGRFPHRNCILNRQSSPEELEYLNSKQAFKG